MSKIVIILILCGTFLLSASHATESKDQQLKAWDDDGWMKSFTTTAKPYTRDPTWDPWARFTWKPPTWKPPTWDPPTETNTENNYSALFVYFGIIVPIIIIAYVLIKLALYFCSSSRSIRNTSSSSNSIRNTRSSISLMPTFSRNSQISLGEDTNVPHVVYRPITPYSGVSVATVFNPREGLSTTVNSRSGAINVNGRSEITENGADKPPGYDAVVLCDLGEKDGGFPKVKASEPETPPPTYDFDHTTRY